MSEPVRYTSTIRKNPAREHPCGLCGRAAYGWDHCHTHGWVRGPVCHGCNVSVGYQDAWRKGVRKANGRLRGRADSLSRRLEWTGKTREEAQRNAQEWIDRCPDCGNTKETEVHHEPLRAVEATGSGDPPRGR